jgi:hypothetical protein
MWECYGLTHWKLPDADPLSGAKGLLMRVWGSYGFPRETRKSLRSPCLGGEPYLLTRTQVVVGAVIARHPARQLRMRIGAADGIDFLYAGRVDGELHD